MTNLSACPYIGVMTHARRPALPLLAVIALTVTGCASTAMPEFDRVQVPADRPEVVVESSEDALDAASLRYIGDAEGYDVYLARGAEDDEVLCLSLVRDGGWDSTSCGLHGVSVGIRPGVAVATSSDRLGGEMREMITESVWISRK